MNRIFTGNYEECKVGNLISISGDRGKKVGMEYSSRSFRAKRNYF